MQMGKGQFINANGDSYGHRLPQPHQKDAMKGSRHQIQLFYGLLAAQALLVAISHEI